MLSLHAHTVDRSKLQSSSSTNSSPCPGRFLTGHPSNCLIYSTSSVCALTTHLSAQTWHKSEDGSLSLWWSSFRAYWCSRLLTRASLSSIVSIGWGFSFLPNGRRRSLALSYWKGFNDERGLKACGLWAVGYRLHNGVHRMLQKYQN